MTNDQILADIVALLEQIVLGLGVVGRGGAASIPHLGQLHGRTLEPRLEALKATVAAARAAGAS